MKSLQVQVISGVKWTTVSQVSRQLISLLTLIILARLIPPRDFGLFGMAMVVINFILLFRDMGTVAAVIHFDDMDDQSLSSMFWVNACVGVIAFLLVFLLSPGISTLYGEADLVKILPWMGAIYIVSGISIIQQAYLEKQMKFRFLSMVDLLSTFSAALAAIASALMGLGVFSLVIQFLAAALVTAVMVWILGGWRPSLSFSWSGIRHMFRYSMNLTGFRIINFFVRNLDDFLIGKVWGAQQLGYYTLAYRIMLTPLQNISTVLTRVLFPAFSRLQADWVALREAFLKVSVIVAFVTFPMMLGLWVLAEPTVLCVLGESWKPVILLLLILVPIGLLHSIVTLVGLIYQSVGRTDVQFRWGVFSGAVVLVGFLIGIRWGVTGIAVSFCLMSILLAYPGIAIPFRLIRLKPADLFRGLIRPMAISLFMAVFLFFLSRMILTDSGSKVHFLILVLVGICLYGIFSMVFNRETISALKDLMSHKDETGEAG